MKWIVNSCLTLTLVSTILFINTNNAQSNSRQTRSDSLVCPRGCSCLRETITCQHANLPFIPPMPRIIPGHEGGPLQFLVFNHNQMPRLESKMFNGLNDVIRLDLSFNNMHWVSRNAFVGLPSLRSLSLRSNRLKHLHHDTFLSVPMLEDLDLSANQLMTIPYSLEGLIFLRRLLLFGNPLHCPCGIADFGQSLKKIEESRYRVTCMSPPEVAHYTLQELSDGLRNYVTNTRLLGYYTVDEGQRSLVELTQPYEPESHLRRNRWMWTHCPVRDFGGTAPNLGPVISSSNESFGEETNFFDRYRHGSPSVLPDEYAPLAWRERPRDIDLVPGSVARFICVPEAAHQLQISWMIPLNATKYISLFRRRQVLQINEVHDYHEGQYTCIAFRNSTRITATAYLRIIEPVKPKISDAPPADNNLVLTGTELRLRCAAIGRPRPNIEWLWQKVTNSIRLLTSGRYTVRGTSTFDETAGDEAEEEESYATSTYQRSNVKINDRIRRFTRQLESHSTLIIRNVSAEDAKGRYICYASNQVGSARVSTVLTVVNSLPEDRPQHQLPISRKSETSYSVIHNTSSSTSHSFTFNQTSEITSEDETTSSLSGEDLVRSVIAKAQKRIEIAIKKTADRLRSSSGRRSAADIASLFRQPNRAALELAKAAEVYEAAIDEVTSILRHRDQQLVDVGGGGRQDGVHQQGRGPHDAETLGVQLTTEQLAIISQLSGCQQSTSADQCSRHLCFHLRFRSIDGTCNNFRNPKWGAALAPLKRLLPPVYENGINTPVGWSSAKSYFGYPKPSARMVSRQLLGNAGLLSRHTQRLSEANERIKENAENTHEAPSNGDDSQLPKFTEQSSRSLFDEDENLSGMVMQWGQFLDHDLDFTPVDASTSRYSDGLGCNETCVNDPPCFPILVPPNDPRIKHKCIGFARSSATCGSGSTSILLGEAHHREQLNQITAYIDASNVYGSDELENSRLRETLHDEGKMRVGIPSFNSSKRMLPFSIRGQVDCQTDPEQDHVPCFKAGDHRSNENLGLLSMHTLWLREHNRVADSLRSLNPYWSGDRVYQEARKIVGACMQAITYTAWLPNVLGSRGMQLLGTYSGYNDQVDSTISNAFATAAMRFGHTLIAPIMFRLDENWGPLPQGHLSLHQAFFAPDRLLQDGGMDPIIRGLMYFGVRDRTKTPPLNPELTERLFSMAHELALDLAALNVQRGRDHGLPSYTEYAFKFCQLGSAVHPDSFDDLAPRISNLTVRHELQRIYGHPGNIDLFTGGILEDLLPEARVGPTFACIISNQFKRLRDGDRFWYESHNTFTPAQLAEIKRAGSSLSRVICHNSDNITRLPENAFRRPKSDSDLVSCEHIPELNLGAWADCSLTDAGQIQVIEGQSSTGGEVHRTRRNVCPKGGSAECHAQESVLRSTTNQQLRRMKRQIDELAEKIEKLENDLFEVDGNEAD